jgi:hypothetical protein
MVSKLTLGLIRPKHVSTQRRRSAMFVSSDALTVAATESNTNGDSVWM